MSKKYLRNQEAWVRRNKARVGGYVEVVKSSKSHEKGWGNSWVNPEMNMSIGKTFLILSIDSNNSSGIELNDASTLKYPYFVLKVVSKPKNITIIEEDIYLKGNRVIFNPDGAIQVGCIPVSYEQVKSIYKHSTKLNKKWKTKKSK